MSDHPFPEIVAAVAVALPVVWLAVVLLSRPAFAALLFVTVVVPALTVVLPSVAVRGVAAFEAAVRDVAPARVCIPGADVCLRVESRDCARCTV